MVKHFVSQSVLDAYAAPRKRYAHYGVVLAISGLLLWFIFLFFGSEPVLNHSASSRSHHSQVEASLSKNLNWLNQKGSAHHSISDEKKKVQKLKRSNDVASSRRQPIDEKRLSASSLVFHEGSQVDKAGKTNTIRMPVVAGDRIVAGEVLHAVLESAIQSDLVGPVRAMLSEPAYAYGTTQLLLPVGTRIIGEYQNKVTTTQERLGICWQRIILPDGRSVTIDAPAVDPVGRVGVRATDINRHFWKRFGEAALYSLLSAGTQISGGMDADTLSAGQLLRAEVSDSFSNTAMSMLEENKQTAVTLSLDPGSDISIFVRHDIVF